MSKSILDQVEEIVKEQHKRLEALSPEQRSVEVVQALHDQVEQAQKNALSIGFVGLFILVIAIFLWAVEYNFSPLSSLGVLAGVILAAVGFWFMQANTIRSRQKILSANFTDEDVRAYFREHETLNQQTAVWWKKGGKFVLGFSVILLIVLAFYRPTTPFGAMMLTVGLGLFFIGLAVVSYVQKMKVNRNSDS